MKSPKAYLDNDQTWLRQHPFLLATIVVFILAAVTVLCWPHRQTTDVNAKELAQKDSAALHVALMPTWDCLPIYYAEQSGIYDSLGLDLRILTYQAQLDTDTAFLRGHVEVAYSDLVRAIMMQQTDTVGLYAMTAPEGTLHLVTARRNRVRTLTQLKERMVAVSRHSITDFWSDRLTDSAHMAQADIFRPQINALRIRTDMLLNGTMDAAFLPEPFASEACIHGNKQHFTTKDQTPHLAAFIVPTHVVGDSTRMQQLKLLWAGYELAVTALQQNPQQQLVKDFLKEQCTIPDSLLDTLTTILPAPAHLTSPLPDDAQAALRWLESRNKARKGYRTDTLIYQADTLTTR